MRFTTSHPRDFTKDIVDAIEQHPKLCNHIHLPVQSGSTDVLHAMQREYTREWYLERIQWTKDTSRDISLTTDIIVGFPGETDRDFEQTITLLDTVGYDGVFGFKYSPRPNTPAIHMHDSIADEVKVQRLAMYSQSIVSARFSARTISVISIRWMEVMVVEGQRTRRAARSPAAPHRTRRSTSRATISPPSAATSMCV